MVKDYLLILRRNLVNPLVISIAILAVGLLLLNELRDAWFISVVITINVTLAIIQEIRARRALRKLEILTAPKAVVLKDGQKTTVAVEAVRRGDVVEVIAGDQLPADGTVVASHGLECDESLLTGEARTVVKQPGDAVFAGSVAVAGSARVKVTAVGVETRAGTMTAHLKRYEPQNTPLQRRIALTIQILTYIAIGLSIVVLTVYLAQDLGLVAALKTITSGTIGVIPEGLLLASTLLLAFGAVKLAQQQVLPQKLSAIEAMALLDDLCVDKTGTLTSDTMQLESIVPFTGTKDQINAYVRTLAHEASGNNATGKAMLSAVGSAELLPVSEVLAFSSERKLSAVKLPDNSVIMMGAPEIVTKNLRLSKKQTDEIDQRVEKGLRVMLLVRAPRVHGSIRESSVLKAANFAPVGLIVLSNALRQNARETVGFLQKRGVRLRVISGDNPKTVQTVAEQAGISGAEKVITGPELEKLPGSAWQQTVEDTVVFARVLPEQKQQIIKALQARGSFVGMVGDGVNDALALKQANLSVAMFAGAAASRRVADIILLNNAFTSLPIGMRLGNRIMQAIELIASLFFHKIIYGILLLLASLVLHLPYPFLPRHLTFMNIFLVTLPSVLWTIFPPETDKRIDPRRFWKHTLFVMLPLASLSFIGILSTYLWLHNVLPGGTLGVAQQAQTITVLMTTLFGVGMVFLVPWLLAVPASKNIHRMRLLYSAGVFLVALVVFAVEPLRSFLDFTAPMPQFMLVPLLFTALTIGAQLFLAKKLRQQLTVKF
ncbi:MAG TPA: HAD-IC family P-type ATPase [Verrucomicrobiae bacterium]|nr:HAD-IC family P-type ATPase [Verrucomicrobiae bacterium]